MSVDGDDSGAEDPTQLRSRGHDEGAFVHPEDIEGEANGQLPVQSGAFQARA